MNKQAAQRFIKVAAMADLLKKGILKSCTVLEVKEKHIFSLCASSFGDFTCSTFQDCTSVGVGGGRQWCKLGDNVLLSANL